MIIDRRSLLASSAAAGAVALAPRAFAQGSQDARLRAALDRYFEQNLDESPETVTSLGLDKGPRAAAKAQLSDNSSAAIARRLAQTKARVAELRAIDRAELSPASALDHEVVLYQQERLARAGERWKFGSVGGNFSPYVVSQRTGVYQGIPDFLDSNHKVANAADAEAYLSRLTAFGRSLDVDTERMKADAGAGVTPPDFVCDLTLGQLKALRDKPAAETILVSSLVKKVAEAKLAGPYAAQAETIVAGEVFPALDRQIAAVQALRAKAASSAGVWALPDGDAYYADCVKASTTTELSPQEIHDVGREQVADLHKRIDAILKTQGYPNGSVGERLTALGSDPKQLYPNTDPGREALLAELNKQMVAFDKRLLEAFATLPKAVCEIRRVPVFIQDGAANGYYQAAALDGSRPAYYFINLKDTHDWPRFGLPSLTYHEATPGHHLQISLIRESEQIPMLRRTGGGLSANTEGWGLYAEQLASEMGVYRDDPLGEVGFLQSLLFRAARLVTDTGIHFKRWSREEATDYMVGATGFPRPRTLREVERYCVSPGQACSYKMGHTIWVKAREAAKAKAGERFDLRTWHDTMLRAGAMPLTVLERYSASWAEKA